MHDWLKEAYADFPKVPQRTVYSFVMKVRQDYNLPRIATNERQYNPMPDTPPGKYAQVDFGHKKLRTGSGQLCIPDDTRSLLRAEIESVSIFQAASDWVGMLRNMYICCAILCKHPIKDV